MDCTLNIFSHPGTAWRILIGPLNENIAIFIIFYRQFAWTFAVNCFTEIILWKVIMILGHCAISGRFPLIFNFGFLGNLMNQTQISEGGAYEFVDFWNYHYIS